MQNKVLNSAFNTFKNTIWKFTHKDAAKMLISMGALSFALSSMAQCWAIKTNDRIDKKKKNFMIAQEAADGAVNIGLFLAITRATWKVSDKLLQLSGLATFSKNKNIPFVMKPNGKSHLKSGCRIFTTMVATVVSCNIITPLVRNIIAGKFRAYKDKKDQLADRLYFNVNQKIDKSSFKGYNALAYNALNNFGNLHI